MHSLSEAKYPAALFVNGIGDHVLTLPAIRALAELFAGKLKLICLPGASQCFWPDLPLRAPVEAEVSPKRGSANCPSMRVFDADTIAGDVGACDLFLSLNPWHSPSVDRLLGLLKPARSVGFFDSFTDRVPVVRHVADHVFQVPLRLEPGLRLEDFAAPPCLSVAAQQEASQLRSAISPRTRILCLHGDTAREKMWAPDRFVTLIDEFLDRHSEFVAVVVGVEDLGFGAGRHHNRVIPRLNRPFAASMAIVGSADMFCGVDSSLLHVADIFRVPTVALFGPTDPNRYGARFAPHRHVKARGNMDEIREDKVLEALEALMEIDPRQRRPQLRGALRRPVQNNGRASRTIQRTKSIATANRPYRDS